MAGWLRAGDWVELWAAHLVGATVERKVGQWVGKGVDDRVEHLAFERVESWVASTAASWGVGWAESFAGRCVEMEVFSLDVTMVEKRAWSFRGASCRLATRLSAWVTGGPSTWQLSGLR